MYICENLGSENRLIATESVFLLLS